MAAAAFATWMSIATAGHHPCMSLKNTAHLLKMLILAYTWNTTCIADGMCFVFNVRNDFSCDWEQSIICHTIIFIIWLYKSSWSKCTSLFLEPHIGFWKKNKRATCVIHMGISNNNNKRPTTNSPLKMSLDFHKNNHIMCEWCVMFAPINILVVQDIWKILPKL